MFVKKKISTNHKLPYHTTKFVYCSQLQSVTTTSGYHCQFSKTNRNLLSVIGTNAKEACKNQSHVYMYWQ